MAFKSVRLNQSLRLEIIKSIMSEYDRNYYKSIGLLEHESIHDRLSLLNEQGMQTFWTMRYGVHLNDIRRIPKELFGNNDFSVKNDRGDVHSRKLKDLPASKNIDLVVSDEIWDDIFKEYLTLKKSYETWNSGRDTFRSEVQSIVDSCNTTKQLVELWPSVEKYLPPCIADPDKGIRLPALSISRLEARLSGGH